jgi:hypothetical protein
MSLRIASALLALFTGFATLAIAESTDCGTPVVIIPDGRLTQSTFPQTTTYWFGIYAQASHSYSVEFEPPANNFLNTYGPQFSPVGIFAPTDALQGCRGTSSVAVTQNSGYAPVIFKSPNGAGRRVSFTAQSSGFYLIYVTNVMGAGAYTFRAVDTTLFSPRWATSDPKDVQWGFFNLSDMLITGTLTILDSNGLILLTAPVSIPPGGRTTRFTGSWDLNLPRNLAGSAMFSHNGPPNAILGDAFLVSSTGNPSPYPIKFETLAPR